MINDMKKLLLSILCISTFTIEAMIPTETTSISEVTELSCTKVPVSADCNGDGITDYYGEVCQEYAIALAEQYLASC